MLKVDNTRDSAMSVDSISPNRAEGEKHQTFVSSFYETLKSTICELEDEINALRANFEFFGLGQIDDNGKYLLTIGSW